MEVASLKAKRDHLVEVHAIAPKVKEASEPKDSLGYEDDATPVRNT